MRTLELSDRSGVSTRQIDHWLRKGYIHTCGEGGGTGHQRDFDADEALVVIQAGALLKVGLTPEHAVRCARVLVHQDAVEVAGFIISRVPSPNPAFDGGDQIS